MRSNMHIYHQEFQVSHFLKFNQIWQIAIPQKQYFGQSDSTSPHVKHGYVQTAMRFRITGYIGRNYSFKLGSA